MTVRGGDSGDAIPEANLSVSGAAYGSGEINELSRTLD